MSEARISDSHVFDLPGPAGGLRISVGWPEGPAPAAGWPGVVVLDGNRLFPLACHSARAQARRPALTHVEPALVIGLDHVPGGDRPAERLRDLTPAVPPGALRPRPNGQPWPATGGAAMLRACLRDTVLPRVARDWPLDLSRLALFGHSLGGLFALDSLLAEPGLFQTWLVSSPSLWFGGQLLLDRLDGLAGALAAAGPLAGGARRMLLSVGALEQSVPPDRQAAVGPAYMGWLEGNRMVDNARDLAARLAGVPGLEFRFRLWEDETHITAPAVAIGQGLRLALRPAELPSDGYAGALTRPGAGGDAGVHASVQAEFEAGSTTGAETAVSGDGALRGTGDVSMPGPGGSAARPPAPAGRP